MARPCALGAGGFANGEPAITGQHGGAFVLRRIVERWLAKPTLIRLKAEFDALRRTAARRARERRMADDEAWRALFRSSDDQDETRD